MSSKLFGFFHHACHHLHSHHLLHFLFHHLHSLHHLHNHLHFLHHLHNHLHFLHPLLPSFSFLPVVPSVGLSASEYLFLTLGSFPRAVLRRPTNDQELERQDGPWRLQRRWKWNRSGRGRNREAGRVKGSTLAA